MLDATAPSGVKTAEPYTVTRARGPGPYAHGSTVTWDLWFRLFRGFCELQKVTEDREKLLMLLQEIGASNVALLTGLLKGADPFESTLVDVKRVLDEQFTPKKLVVAERYKLLQARQKEGQSLPEFYGELQTLANTCALDKVTDVRDALVLMTFVAGVQSVETRKRLLESDKALTSSDALSLAEAHEKAGQSAPVLGMSEQRPSVAGLHQVHQSKARGGGRPQYEAYQDGPKESSSHPTRGERGVCAVCKKPGHWASACWFRKGHQNPNPNQNQRRGARSIDHPKQAHRTHNVQAEPTLVDLADKLNVLQTSVDHLADLIAGELAEKRQPPPTK